MPARLRVFTLPVAVCLTTLPQGSLSSAADSFTAPASSVGVPSPAASGEQTPDVVSASVERAIFNIASLESLSARLRFSGEVLGERLLGSGSYLQRGIGTSRRYRWQMQVPLAKGMTTLVQIGSHDTLWLYDELPQPRLRRIDLKRVRQELRRRHERTPLAIWMAEPGGLAGFLEMLRGMFRFREEGSSQYRELRVHQLTGTCREDVLRQMALFPGGDWGGEDPVSGSAIPEQFPDTVLLLLGQDDEFPYAIDFLRTTGSYSPRRLLRVEWFEVRFNVPIDDALFQYVPQMPVSDVTDKLLTPASSKSRS